MEAEKVIKKILADAKAEAEQIKSEAGKQQAGEKAKVDAQLSRYRQQSGILAEKAAEDHRQRILAAARMAIAKELLADKTKIINEVFAEAEGQLKALPDEQYCGLMAKLMVAAVETGDEEVLLDKSETRLNQKFLKAVNRDIGPGYRGNLRLSEERLDIGGGFVLRRGKVRNNMSFSVLLGQAREELGIELAKELFAE